MDDSLYVHVNYQISEMEKAFEIYNKRVLEKYRLIKIRVKMYLRRSLMNPVLKSMIL